MNDLSAFLTTRQAADRTSVSVDTIRRWIRIGVLPAVRIGPTSKNIRIHPADLDKMVRDE